MAKYPNQRSITIHSSSGRKRVQIPYGIITEKEKQTAFWVLDDKRGGTPILLFFVLASYKNGYAYDFSPAALERKYGIAADRWRNAFHVLLDRGYLIEDEKNHYYFESLPVQYQNISFVEETAEAEKANGDNADLPWEDELNTFDEDIPWLNSEDDLSHYTDNSTAIAETDTPADRDSNNSISYNYSRTYQTDDFLFKRPEYDAVIKTEIEIKGLSEEIRKDFGYLENTETDINEVIKIANKQPKGFSRVVKHVQELRKLYSTLQADRIDRVQRARRDYHAAVRRTIPQGSDATSVEYAKTIDLILKDFEQEYRACHNGLSLPRMWGIWVNGWNEELQKPNILISTHALPKSVLEKQQHNLNGIPDDYIESLKQTG